MTDSTPGLADQPGLADEVVVIGAGPAGLTAAYELSKAGRRCTVLEGDSVVGGISRTVERDGWRFDIGGHRFFTKVRPVEELWHEILPDEEFMLRPRKSRIYYQGKFYDYPLKASNALRNLGVIEAVRCVLSYAWARVRPPADQHMYEGWLASRFGWRLYRHFFKTYTEKVWGHPPSEMPADWAAQRVKNLSLFTAIVNALLPKRNQKDVTSLIEEFQYPKLGPGMMWERCRDLVESAGTKVLMDTHVRTIRHSSGKAFGVIGVTDGARTEYPASAVIASLPMAALIEAMDPPAPEPVRKAAADLYYRDFLTVALVVPAESVPWDDNWIYIHDTNVKTMRIQNFGSWSPYLVKNGRNVLGLEYTVEEGDADWNAPDDALIERGKQELARLGLIDPQQVEDGYVVRMPKAYPYYDVDYKDNVQTIRDWLDQNASNVYPVGRNGMHRYNNQDHSMYTAMLTVENLLGANHDVWSVNVEEEYHEINSGSVGAGSQSSGAPTGREGSGRDAPVLPKRTPAA
ncbi:MAG TPA: NAD(P)/FAD-dependent oxidoreductase [Acidimicrobiales bacterium]|nr:NAD(P)/FAD-dependent oxidoreductase [Acidimicrobiales bacterium]